MSKQKDPARIRLDAKLHGDVINYLVHRADVKLEDPIENIEIDYHQKPEGRVMIGIYVNGKITGVINSTSVGDQELFSKLREYYNIGIQENNDPIAVNVDREIPLNYNYLLEMRERYKDMVISPWDRTQQKFVGTHTFDAMIDLVMLMPMNRILDMLTDVVDATKCWVVTPPDGHGYSLLSCDNSVKLLDTKTMLFYTVVYNALSQRNKKCLVCLDV